MATKISKDILIFKLIVENELTVEECLSIMRLVNLHIHLLGLGKPKEDPDDFSIDERKLLAANQKTDV